MTKGSHCEACHATIVAQEVIPAKGHTEVIRPGRDATCVKGGFTESKYCDTCGATLMEQESIPAKGHMAVIDEAVAPTCTETGLTEGSHCSVCGEIIVRQTVVPATDHSYDLGVVTAEPTCTTAGAKTFTCSGCGTTKTETVPVKAHTVVTDKAVAATTDKTGLTEGSHCSVCGAVIKEQEVVPVVPASLAQTKISSVTNTATGITVKWNKVSGATHYQVWRKVGTSSWKLIKTTTATSLTNTKLSSGTKYQYKVRAIVKDGSTIVSIGAYSTIKTMYFVAQPKISSVTNTKSGITVKWGKIKGATSYKVYRKAGTGSWKLLKTTTATSYSNAKLTNGTKYQYKIVAVKKVGSTNYKSAYSTAKTLYRLTSPTLATGTKSIATRKIVVKWNKNTKANGYQIKYVKGSTAKTVKVKGASSLSKTLNSLTKGSTYKIYVRSYKTVGGKTYYSAYSAYKSIKVVK